MEEEEKEETQETSKRERELLQRLKFQVILKTSSSSRLSNAKHCQWLFTQKSSDRRRSLRRCENSLSRTRNSWKNLNNVNRYRRWWCIEWWLFSSLTYEGYFACENILTLFQQKLLLTQLTSAKKVLPPAAESPDTSFEYIPPKVRYYISIMWFMIFQNINCVKKTQRPCWLAAVQLLTRFPRHFSHLILLSAIFKLLFCCKIRRRGSTWLTALAEREPLTSSHSLPSYTFLFICFWTQAQIQTASHYD